MYLDLFNN